MPPLKKLVWIICICLPLFAGAQRLPYGVSPRHYGLTFTPDLRKAAKSDVVLPKRLTADQEAIRVGVVNCGHILRTSLQRGG